MLIKALVSLLISLALIFSSSTFAKPQQIDLVTEHYPPFQILGEDGVVSGKYVEITNKILSASGIPSTTRVMPWARAYHIAQNTPNTCIYGIVRETFREPMFIWIAEIGNTVGTFYTSKAQAGTVKLRDLNDAYQYVIAVQRQGITTELLQRRGFLFQQNLLDVTDWQQAIHLVLRGRANLVVSNNDIIGYHLEMLDVPADALVPLIDYEDVKNARQYLACSVDTEPALIARLKAAARSLNLPE